MGQEEGAPCGCDDVALLGGWGLRWWSWLPGAPGCLAGTGAGLLVVLLVCGRGGAVDVAVVVVWGWTGALEDCTGPVWDHTGAMWVCPGQHGSAHGQCGTALWRSVTAGWGRGAAWYVLILLIVCCAQGAAAEGGCSWGCSWTHAARWGRCPELPACLGLVLCVLLGACRVRGTCCALGLHLGTCGRWWPRAEAVCRHMVSGGAAAKRIWCTEEAAGCRLYATAVVGRLLHSM